MPSRNGGLRRSTSGRFDDSILMTVAPYDARYPAVIGPTPTQDRSSTRRPSNGGGASSTGSAAAAGGGPRGRDASSASCSPTWGARRVVVSGVADRWAHG